VSGFLVFQAGVATEYAEHIKQQNVEQHSGPIQAEENWLYSFWKWTTHDPVAFYTSALALFTGILGVSTIGLWIVTARGVKNQTSDTQIIQRAYIAVEGGGINPLDPASVAHITVRNVGNLPARGVRWFIDAAPDADGRRSEFLIKEDRFYGNNVLPRGTEMARSQIFLMTGEWEATFKAGHAEIYVWGEIRYLDGFGNERFTRFCHRYGKRGLVQHLTDFKTTFVQTVIFEEISAESMRYHQYGNDAD
jgi:hypothetical protein